MTRTFRFVDGLKKNVEIRLSSWIMFFTVTGYKQVFMQDNAASHSTKQIIDQLAKRQQIN